MGGVFQWITSKNRLHLFSQNNDEVPPPSRTEVDRAIQRLKNNKSVGGDGIPADLLKGAGATFNRLLSNI